MEVKAEVAKLRKLVNKFHERLVFPMPVIIEVQPKVEIKNIWSVSVREEGGKKTKQEKKAPKMKY